MKRIINFRHYTSLASLIHVLTHKKLTLADPSKWEDRNDAVFLKLYGEKTGYKTIYAICFTTTHETSHHWKIYASGKHGVCLKIDARKILEKIKSNSEIRHGLVEYKFVREVEDSGVKIDQMPFLKRKAFLDEEEYRIIYQSKKQTQKPYFEIPIELNWIGQIYLSHSMPQALVKSVCDMLHSIEGCSGIKIGRTSLNENTQWKKLGENAT